MNDESKMRTLVRSSTRPNDGIRLSINTGNILHWKFDEKWKVSDPSPNYGITHLQTDSPN